MRVVFMGTPEFAVASLCELHCHHTVVGVYTRADAASGRGNTLHPTPVKAKALELGLPVFTPKNFKSAADVAELAALEPDIIVVAAYGVILPVSVLSLPIHGCVNVHASLLPRWRGAAPIQRAILAGDKTAGVCIMRMEEGLDTGDYCSCVSTQIDDKGASDLIAELSEMGALALIRSLKKIEAGMVEWVPQNEAFVTYADKISKEELLLDPALSAQVNIRRVRASSAAAPAKAVICGKVVTVLSVRPTEDVTVVPGEVSFEHKRFLLGCAQGVFELSEIKPDGKSAMPAKAWMAGLQKAQLTWSTL